MKLGLTWREKLGKPECPYLERWVLNLGRYGSIRLHHWIRSDDKRAKHDHPADFITLVLKGSYVDRCDGKGYGGIHPSRCGVCGGADRWFCDICGNNLRSEHMRPFMFRKRTAEHSHTVDVMPGGCWTLLYFWPDRRKWGFWTTRADGTPKWKKANKYFLERGHHPCDQP